MTFPPSLRPIARRPRQAVSLCFALLLGAGLGAACTGGGEGAVVAAQRTVDVEGDVIARAWTLEVATQAEQGAFADDGVGWIDLVVRRDYASATRKMGRAGGLVAARAHADAAALYRQAALTSANALVQTYAESPEETDPVGVAHLLTVSFAVNGNLERAREHAARFEGVEDPTLDWHAPWKTWLDSGADWPPDLTGLPLELPEPTAGTWPEAGNLPHYRLPEQSEDARKVAMGDPGALVALALWHEATAVKAAGEHAPQVLAYGGRHRLPVEPVPDAAGSLPLELLFGSELLSPEDADFLSAVHRDGHDAIDAFKGRSLLAALADASREDGVIDSQTAIDNALALRRRLVDEAQAKSGVEDASHRVFADIATVAALRGLALVAEAAGDREGSGVLRITAIERSVAEAACPVGMLSLAAWDAQNRYPARGADILHNLSRRYPSLETARFGLDVMALRVSRERTDQLPGI